MTPDTRTTENPEPRTDDWLADYVRHHQCWQADPNVTIADWHRGILAIEAEAAQGAAPRAEGLDANWLSDELGMHQFVNDRQCDCGDWDTFRDKGTFNDHVAAEIVARLSERRDKEGTE